MEAQTKVITPDLHYTGTFTRFSGTFRYTFPPNYRRDHPHPNCKLGLMLTSQELANLELLLSQARALVDVERAAVDEAVHPGDLVQLRPGADHHWETSLLLVTQIREKGDIRGILLREHRSGCQEAWYTYSKPEICKIGRMPYPAPSREVRRQVYEPPCPTCSRRY